MNLNNQKPGMETDLDRLRGAKKAYITAGRLNMASASGAFVGTLGELNEVYGSEPEEVKVEEQVSPEAKTAQKQKVPSETLKKVQAATNKKMAEELEKAQKPTAPTKEEKPVEAAMKAPAIDLNDQSKFSLVKDNFNSWYKSKLEGRKSAYEGELMYSANPAKKSVDGLVEATADPLERQKLKEVYNYAKAYTAKHGNIPQIDYSDPAFYNERGEFSASGWLKEKKPDSWADRQWNDFKDWYAKPNNMVRGLVNTTASVGLAAAAVYAAGIAGTAALAAAAETSVGALWAAGGTAAIGGAAAGSAASESYNIAANNRLSTLGEVADAAEFGATTALSLPLGGPKGVKPLDAIGDKMATRGNKFAEFLGKNTPEIIKKNPEATGIIKSVIAGAAVVGTTEMGSNNVAGNSEELTRAIDIAVPDNMKDSYNKYFDILNAYSKAKNIDPDMPSLDEILSSDSPVYDKYKEQIDKFYSKVNDKFVKNLSKIKGYEEDIKGISPISKEFLDRQNKVLAQGDDASLADYIRYNMSSQIGTSSAFAEEQLIPYGVNLATMMLMRKSSAIGAKTGRFLGMNPNGFNQTVGWLAAASNIPSVLYQREKESMMEYSEYATSKFNNNLKRTIGRTIGEFSDNEILAAIDANNNNIDYLSALKEFKASGRLSSESRENIEGLIKVGVLKTVDKNINDAAMATMQGSYDFMKNQMGLALGDLAEINIFFNPVKSARGGGIFGKYYQQGANNAAEFIGKSQLKRKLNLAAGIASKWLKTSVIEAGEEGSQYITGTEYVNDIQSGKDAFDGLYNAYANDITSYSLALGLQNHHRYLDMGQLKENILLGAIMPFFMPQTHIGTIKELNDARKSDRASRVVENSLLNRVSTDTNIEKIKTLLSPKYAKDPSRILDALTEVGESLDENSTWTTKEDIENEKRLIKRAYQIAATNPVREFSKRNNIEYGSEDHSILVGLISDYENESARSLQNVNEHAPIVANMLFNDAKSDATFNSILTEINDSREANELQPISASSAMDLFSRMAGLSSFVQFSNATAAANKAGEAIGSRKSIFPTIDNGSTYIADEAIRRFSAVTKMLQSFDLTTEEEAASINLLVKDGKYNDAFSLLDKILPTSVSKKTKDALAIVTSEGIEASRNADKAKILSGRDALAERTSRSIQTRLSNDDYDAIANTAIQEYKRSKLLEDQAQAASEAQLEDENRADDLVDKIDVVDSGEVTETEDSPVVEENAGDDVQGTQESQSEESTTPTPTQEEQKSTTQEASFSQEDLFGEGTYTMDSEDIEGPLPIDELFPEPSNGDEPLDTDSNQSTVEETIDTVKETPEETAPEVAEEPETQPEPFTDMEQLDEKQSYIPEPKEESENSTDGKNTFNELSENGTQNVPSGSAEVKPRKTSFAHRLWMGKKTTEDAKKWHDYQKFLADSKRVAAAEFVFDIAPSRSSDKNSDGFVIKLEIIEPNGNRFKLSIPDIAMYDANIARFSESMREILTDAELAAERQALIDYRNELIKANYSKYHDSKRDGLERRIVPARIVKVSGVLLNENQAAFRPIHIIPGFGLMDKNGKFNPHAIQFQNFQVAYSLGEKGQFRILDISGIATGASSRNSPGSPYVILTDTVGNRVPIHVREGRMSDESSAIELATALFEFAYNKLASNRISDERLKAEYGWSISPYALLTSVLNFGVHTDRTLNQSIFLAEKAFFIKRSEAGLPLSLHIGNGADGIVFDLQNRNATKDDIDKAITYIVDHFTWSFSVKNLFDGVRNEYNTVEQVWPGISAVFEGDPNLKQIEVMPGLIVKRGDESAPFLGWMIGTGRLQSNHEDNVFNTWLHAHGVQEVVSGQNAPVKADGGIIAQNKEQEPQKAAIQPVDKGKNVAKTVVGRKSFGKLGAKRVSSGAAIATPEKLRAEIAWAKNALGLEDEDFEIVMSIANDPLVMGRMRAESILLAEAAEIGTVYHEAYHRVSLLLLSPKQRQAAYKLYREANPESAFFSDVVVEEEMAEGLREFMLNNGPTVKGSKVNVIYRRLYNMIASILNISPRNLNRLYNDIAIGAFKPRRINKESLAEFNAKYETGPNRMMKLKTMKASDANIYTNAIVAGIFMKKGLSDIRELVSAALDDAMEVMQEALDYEVESGTSDVIIARHKEVIANMATIFYPKVKQRLEEIGFKQINEEVEEGSEANIIGEALAQSIKASYEFSKKDNLAGEVKAFIMSIPESEIVDGEIFSKAHPFTNMTMFVPFDVAWNKLLYHLSDYDNITDMMHRIVELGKTDPFFTIVGSNLSDESVEFNTKFWSTIFSHRHKFINISYTGESGKLSNFMLIDSEVDSYEKLKAIEWGNNFSQNEKVFIPNEDGISVNVDEIDKIIASYNALVAYATPDKAKSKTDELAYTIKEGILRTLKRAGIEIDIDTLNTLIKREREFVKKDAHEVDVLYSLLVSQRFDRHLGGKSRLDMSIIFNTVLPGFAKKVQKAASSKSISMPQPELIFRTEKSVLRIANADQESHPSSEESSVIGADNAKIYSISLNNFITDRIRAIRNSEWIAKALGKVAYIGGEISADGVPTGSLILESITKSRRSGQPVRLSLKTFIKMYNDAGGDRGSDYFGIDAIQDYLAKMTMLRRNIMIAPTMADKKSYMAISGVKLYTGDANNVEISVQQDAAIGTNVFKARMSDAVLDRFDKYFKAEYLAIRDAWRQRKDAMDANEKVNESLLKEIFHYKGVNPKTGKAWAAGHGNGLRFRNAGELMVKLFDKTTKKYHAVRINFNDIIDESVATYGEIEGMEKAFDAIEQQYLGLDRASRMNIINSSLEYQINQELINAEKLGLIKYDGARKSSISNILLDADQIAVDESGYMEAFMANGTNTSLAHSAAVYNAIAQYAINSMVSINEFEKVFIGDPAVAKTPDDKIKRFTSLLSTGRNLRTDYPTGHRLHGVKDFSVVELNDNEISTPNPKDVMMRFIASAVNERLVSNGISRISNLYNLLSDESNGDAEAKAQLDELKKDKTIADAISSVSNDAGIVAGYSGYDNDGVNETDATVYVSPRMYRNMLEMMGYWSPEMDEAMNLLESDDQSWMSDVAKFAKVSKLLLQPRKMIHVGHTISENKESNNSWIVLDKMAMFPVFKVMAHGDLGAIYEQMTKVGDSKEMLGIDMFAFKSAVKLGGANRVSMYSDSSNAKLNDLSRLPKTYQKYENLREQLVTDPHMINDMATGSQVIKASMANIDKNKIYKGIKSVDGTRDLNGSEVIEMFNDIINTLSDMGLNDYYKDLGYDGNTLDMSKFAKFLFDQLSGPGTPQDMLDTLSDAMTNPAANPLQGLMDNKRIERKLIAAMEKSVIDINLPGGMFIQMSTFGLKATEREQLNSGKISQEDFDAKYNGKFLINGGNKLNMFRDDNTIECAVSINMFDDILPEYVKRLSFNNQRNWLMKMGLIGPNARKSALGYRIPTQGLSSISALSVVDVIPGMLGDVIVLPSEFTKTTGSDFDIDKLFLARHNYKFVKKSNGVPANPEVIDAVNKGFKIWNESIWKVENGVIYLNKERSNSMAQNKRDFVEEAYKGAYIYFPATGALNETEVTPVKYELNQSKPLNQQNKLALGNALIDLLMNVVTAEDTMHQTKMPLDTATDDLKKNILPDIEKALKKDAPVGFFQLFTPRYQLAKKIEYTTSKRGIGPFALSAVHHVLTQMSNLKANSTETNVKFGLLNLDTQIGIDGVRVLDWLSAMINAHVDVAKDPYIMRLNVNPMTYDLVALLLRAGKGKTTFYFTAQNILKDVYTQFSTSTAEYTSGKKVSDFEKMEATVNDVRNKYLEMAASYAKTSDQKKALDKIKGLKYRPGSDNAHVLSLDFLREQLHSKQDSYDYYYNQLMILEAFKEIKYPSGKLSNLVTLSQVDTKKAGKTFAELTMYLKKFNNMMSAIGTENDPFANLAEFMGKTFIGKKTANMQRAINSVMTGVFFRTSPNIMSLASDMMKLSKGGNYSKAELYSKILDYIDTSLKSEFYEKFAAQNNINIKSLFYGNNSLARQLYSIKAKIADAENYPEYQRYVGNELLETISYSFAPRVDESRVKFKKPDHITVMHKRNESALSAEAMKVAWEEMLLDEPITAEERELNDFAKKLFVYEFFANGENSSLHLVKTPEEARKGLSIDYTAEDGSVASRTYYDFISTKLREINDYLITSEEEMNIIDEVFTNRWYDNELVPEVKLSETDIRGENSYYAKRIKAPIAGEYADLFPSLFIDGKAGKPTAHNSLGEGLFPLYVKVSADFAGEKIYTLYKLIGNIRTGKTVSPVYAAVNKKGDKRAGKMVIDPSGDMSILDYNNTRSAFDIQGYLDAMEISREAGLEFIGKYLSAYNKALDAANSGRKRITKSEAAITLDQFNGISIYTDMLPGDFIDNETYEFEDILTPHQNAISAVDELISRDALSFDSVVELVSRQTENLDDSYELKASITRSILEKVVDYIDDNGIDNIENGLELTEYINMELSELGDNGMMFKSIPSFAPGLIAIKDPVVEAQRLRFTNHSGGAMGSDTEWDIIGREFADIENKHYREPAEERGPTSTPGYVDSQTLRDAGVTSVDLEESEYPGVYEEGKAKSTAAARAMGRIGATHNVRSNYIIRNWAQVKFANSIYAVGNIIPAGASMDHGKTALIEQVNGGTGFAVQMAIAEYKPVYVFNQSEDNGYAIGWYTWDGTKFIQTETPILTRDFAGIGTREINEAGKQAIRSVYQKTFVTQTQNVSELIDAIYSTLGDKTKTNNITIDDKAGRVASSDGSIVAYRTRGDNFLEAFQKDNAIGNPWSPFGYSIYKVDTAEDAVKAFGSWLLGLDHTDVLQDYRQAIIDKLPELKGKNILYYKELNEPSHATMLDYVLNKSVLSPQTQPETIKPGVADLFESNPELAKIGTPEQYSQYLDTIFPDSKVKDILYHGTNNEFDEFDQSKLGATTGTGDFENRATGEVTKIDSANAFFFSDRKETAISYSFLGRYNHLSDIRHALAAIVYKHGGTFENPVEFLKGIPYFDDLIQEAKANGATQDERLELLKIELKKLETLLEDNRFDRITNRMVNISKDTATVSSFISEVDRFILGDQSIKNRFGDFVKYDFSVEGYYIHYDVEKQAYLFIKKDNGEPIKTYVNEMSKSEVLDYFNEIKTSLSKQRDELTSDIKRLGYKESAMSAVLNIQNPLIHDYSGSSFPDKYNGTELPTSYIAANQVKSALENNNDAVMYKNVVDPVLATNYGVFDTSNIHILGTKKDMEMFKSFIGSGISTKTDNKTVQFSEFGTTYRFEVDENNTIIDATYSQGKSGEFKQLTQKKWDSKFAELSAKDVEEKPELPTKEEATKETKGGKLNIKTDRESLSKLGITFDLNEGQIEALNKISAWFNNPDVNSDSFFSLKGAAGSGKSTIIQAILYAAQQAGIKTAVAAQTNEQAAGLRKMLKAFNKNAYTVHTLLAQKPILEFTSDAVELSFEEGFRNKVPANGVVIVDEVSMMDDTMVDKMIGIANEKNAKVIFIGDQLQLFPIPQKFLSKGFKASDEAFSSELTKVERQVADTKLSQTISKLRGFLADENSTMPIREKLIRYLRPTESKGDSSISYITPGTFDKWVKEFVDQFVRPSINAKEPKYVKMIAYKNDRVDELNDQVRKALGYGETIVPGEFITSKLKITDTANVDGKRVERILMNKNDSMIVDSVSDAMEMSINAHLGPIKFIGREIVLKNASSGFTHSMFQIEDDSKLNNLDEIAEIISANMDAIRYIGDRRARNAAYKVFSEAMGGKLLLLKDLKYNNKVIFAKTMIFGYAGTIHSAQGNQHHTVVVDEAEILGTHSPSDMDKLRALYVSFSRATNNLIVISEANSSYMKKYVSTEGAESVQDNYPANEFPVLFSPLKAAEEVGGLIDEDSHKSC